jgi:hypothetical protein
VPLQKGNQEKKDAKADIHFKYDEQNDCIICSEGRKLALKDKNKKKRNQKYFVYQGDCEGCAKRNQCTKSAKGRIVHRNHQQIWIDSYKNRIKTQEFKMLIKERKTIVEHPFGTIKSWMGKFPLRLRGKEKVQAEIDIFTTAYNIKRLISLENMENLLNMASNFPWKVA